MTKVGDQKIESYEERYNRQVQNEKRKQIGKKFLKVAALGGIAYGIYSCNAADGRTAAESRQRISEAAAGSQNPRLQEILDDLAFDQNGQTKADATALRILHDQHYKVELTDELPVGAMLEIDKNRIRINDRLARDTQCDLLQLATEYIDGQVIDHQPYGDGELFTLGSGRLIQVAKNQWEHQKVLIPGG